MRRPKFRIDTLGLTPLPDGQLLLEDFLDKLAGEEWVFVDMFFVGDMVWIVSRRSWWWRLMH